MFGISWWRRAGKANAGAQRWSRAELSPEVVVHAALGVPTIACGARAGRAARCRGSATGRRRSAASWRPRAHATGRTARTSGRLSTDRDGVVRGRQVSVTVARALHVRARTGIRFRRERALERRAHVAVGAVRVSERPPGRGAYE